MMSSTSLQSTFAILKEKKIKRKRHLILSMLTKEMHIYWIKVSQMHKQNIMFPIPRDHVMPFSYKMV